MSGWAIISIVIGGVIIALEVVYPICWITVTSIRKKRRKKYGEAEQ